jgi:hypothetical protein
MGGMGRRPRALRPQIPVPGIEGERASIRGLYLAPVSFPGLGSELLCQPALLGPIITTQAKEIKGIGSGTGKDRIGNGSGSIRAKGNDEKGPKSLFSERG